MRLSVADPGTVRLKLRRNAANSLQVTTATVHRPGYNYDFSHNPSPTFQIVEVGHERNAVILVDRLFGNPASVLRCVRETANFVPGPEGGSHFPGVRSPGPDCYLDAFLKALEGLIRETYKISSAVTFNAATMFSLTTTRPGELVPLQRVPHYDGAGLSIISAVHFLFRRPLGGTAFYRHRATGYETISKEREARYNQILNAELAEQGMPEEYITSSNDLFEQTFDAVPAFDRLIVFPGHMLHSGSINAAAGLPQDVDRGRLTANTFLTLT